MFNKEDISGKEDAIDEKAFKQLFEAHRDKLFNYLVIITKSREIAEEIVIDVFVKLWTGRELIPEIVNLDAFLHKVAYNKALDFFRIASRNTRLQALINQEMLQDREKEADVRLLENECNEILHKALAQLSPQRRAVFTLSRLESLTYEEIAARLNLSRNTVRNTIAESLKSIRRFLITNDFNGIAVLWLLLNISNFFSSR